jgi:hypothetical protein
MQIKHELIRDVVRVWAVEINRENVGRAVSSAYFRMGGGALRLLPAGAPNADHVNQQNLFRWLDSDSAQSKAKVLQLLPAILSALPRQLSARLVLANSLEYRAIQQARAALDEAADAYVAATVVDLVNHITGSTSASVVLH